jgi:hypothetical protein
MNPVVGLSIGRILVGIASFARPDLAHRALGLRAPEEQVAFGFRLFGSREVALGAATLLAAGGPRRSLLVLGVGVDAADAAASVMAHREKSLDTVRAAAFTGVAVVAVLQGLAGLRVRK